MKRHTTARDALLWSAAWVENSGRLSGNKAVIDFAVNQAMTIRAEARSRKAVRKLAYELTIWNHERHMVMISVNGELLNVPRGCAVRLYPFGRKTKKRRGPSR